MAERSWYERGIEPVEGLLSGWAVFSASEGDDPTFRGFFPDECDAHAFAEAEDPSPHAEDGEPICFDPCVVAAVWRDGTLYCANDYDLNTVEALVVRLDRRGRR